MRLDLHLVVGGWGVPLGAAAALLLCSIPIASAQGAWAETVLIFKKICVDPKEPAAMIAVGERIAEERGWKLDKEKSGRIPFFFMHQPPEPGGKPFFVSRFWHLVGPSSMRDTTFLVLIAGPEYKDVKYTICGLTFAGQFVDELSFEIEKLFGASISEKASSAQPGLYRQWLFPADGNAAAQCSRAMLIDGHDNQTFLQFLEMQFPKEWGAISAGLPGC